MNINPRGMLAAYVLGCAFALCMYVINAVDINSGRAMRASLVGLIFALAFLAWDNIMH